MPVAQPAQAHTRSARMDAASNARQILQKACEGVVTEKQQELQRALDELQREHDALNEGKAQIAQGKARLQQEKADLEEYVGRMMQEQQKIQDWLQQHSGEAPDPDTIVIPSDTQSRQLLELEAKNSAIEDTLFALADAYEEIAADPRHHGETDGALANYLREVRKLGKEQFFLVALKRKIAARRGQTT